MRKLLITMVLLLLLPLAIGINVQADETEPPPDPGLGDDGDVEGDHPWGGEERVIIIQDKNDPRFDLRESFTFDKYVRLFVYVYYGLDFLDRPAIEPTRTGTVTRFETQRRYSFGFDSKKRSR